MQTFKTAIVVVILLGVLYGVYVVLNTPEAEMPPGIDWPPTAEMTPPVFDLGQAESGDRSVAAIPKITAPPIDSSIPEPPFASPPITTSEGAADVGFAPPANPSPAGSFYSQADNQPNTSEQSSEALAGSYHVGDEAPKNPAAGNEENGSFYLPNPKVTLVEANQGDSDNPALGLSDAGSTIGNRAFANAVREATSNIQSGKFREALFTLSIFYKSKDLTNEDQEQLLDMLDPLAARVIYSNEHMLVEPHVVRQSEDLKTIAAQYQVPWQLLANINGVQDPNALVPNTELKVVDGPFRAEVDLQRGELTLFLNRLYAGRFPITVGADPRPRKGTYTVRGKQRNRGYYGGTLTLPPGDPKNPFGDVWIDLGNHLAIHGSPREGQGNSQLGSISLSPRDANDVYGILSENSTVNIDE